MRRITIDLGGLVSARMQRGAVLIALLAASSSGAYAQSISDDLPYPESVVRDKIAAYNISVHSSTYPAQIPPHVFYRLAFLDVMSDEALMAELTASDREIILALPAHEDAQFVALDVAALSAVCQGLDGSNADVVMLAQAFDRSREQRERRLDAHYAQVLTTLTGPGRQLIEQARQTAHWQVTYSAYLMEGLALDAPDIAGAILEEGCSTFATHALDASLPAVQLYSQRAGQPMHRVSE